MRVNRGKPFRVDQDMNPIRGGEAIVEILNIAVTSGGWTAVQLPATLNLACKSVLAKLKAGTAWRLSYLATGARYITITNEVSIDLVQDQAAILFYAQSVAATGILEVVLLD